MSSRYHHTQPGWVILGSTVPPALITLAVGTVPEIPTWPTGLILLVAAALFASLTVDVADGAIVARFGPGLIRRRVALRDVREARVVTNRWWYGWGLRLIRGGTLYNVSGFHAVELALTDGRVWRVGTDEPEALLAAVRAQAGLAATAA
ncbi:MAG: hypothetical protein IT374_18780 [Polyangiaceae bacterium]|nr:hypothetical protein [Polyangiaceae bacterium]